jgi:hypothetical protein
MNLISMHQPNYFPWLGYFNKLIHSDTFIFLDDVQFSKGSYTNRVHIVCEGKKKWLTVPIKVNLGKNIHNIKVANHDWIEHHLRIMKSYYIQANCFKEVYIVIEKLMHSIKSFNISEINIFLIKEILKLLDINTKVINSSTLSFNKDVTGDDRLIAIIKSFETSTTYISGSGGSNYQSEKKFKSNNIPIQYIDNTFKAYSQVGCKEYINGLSILDVLFNIGWDNTKKLIL